MEHINSYLTNIPLPKKTKPCTIQVAMLVSINHELSKVEVILPVDRSLNITNFSPSQIHPSSIWSVTCQKLCQAVETVACCFPMWCTDQVTLSLYSGRRDDCISPVFALRITALAVVVGTTLVLALMWFPLQKMAMSIPVTQALEISAV